MSEDTCPTCGKWTHDGLLKMAIRSREDPLFGTNLKQPISGVFQETRDLLYKARNIMDDLRMGYPGYSQAAVDVAGTLTVLMVFLYHEIQECKKREEETKKDA